MRTTPSAPIRALLAPVGLLALVGAPVLHAQTATPATPGLAAFRALHGPSWTALEDSNTGELRLLFGDALPSPVRPRTSADYVRVARSHVGSAAEVLGLEPRDLVLDRELFLPLGLVGSSDKVTVRFLQSFRGLPVEDASVDVLLAVDGDLLAIFKRALPLGVDFVTEPGTTEGDAVETAWAAFGASDGVSASYVRDWHLAIVGAGPRRDPNLAWVGDVVLEEGGIVTGGYRYAISAEAGEPRVLSRTPLVHQLDVGGQVFTNATPGLSAQSSGNPQTPQALPFATVTSPQAGTTTTDADGLFNYPGVTGPIDVTVAYEGTYNDVESYGLTNHSQTVSMSGTGNVLTLNPTNTEFVTAEANAFVWIDRLGEWIRSVNPADTTPNFVADALVNIPPGVVANIDACNAFWNGNSTNYFRAGSIGSTNCSNTAFSSVVAHEMGHWLNFLYASGNGPDGFGEGNADVFAMYLVDDSIVGQGFYTSGGFIRTGLNTRPYCGDGNGGCYGQVHTDGEPHMGAFWKMRVALKNALGADAGGDVADALFLGFMNAFDQTTIDSLNEVLLLVVDDDDGVQSNGTPHQTWIESGFRQQGFPGRGVVIGDVTVLGNTLDQAGPYGVGATLEPVFSAGIAAADVAVRVNGGPETLVPMTNAGGNRWVALVPGIASPARVAYEVRATNTNGLTSVFADPSLRFSIGEEDVFVFEDFEGATDAGWTHVEVATQDDWQRGAPTGKSGTSQGVTWADPAAAFSGSNCWGNDLGPQGFNGAYQPDVVNFLRSPTFDLSAASNVQLSFQRWLTVEEGQFDQAQILVNGIPVWTNPAQGHTRDTAWTAFAIDVANLADGNPSVEVEFRLTSDSFLNLGGWNVDDFALSSFTASPTACLPTTFGSGLAGAQGVPVLDTRGQPSRVGNQDFAFAVKNGPPGSIALVGRGPVQLSVPVFGGTLLVDPKVIDALALDEFGQALLPLPIPASPGLVGLVRHVQAFVVDASAPSGVSMTAGLTVTVCN